MNFTYRVAFHNIVVYCPDFAQENLIKHLDDFKTVNRGIDNLVGCDYTSPQILFVHNEKLEHVKELLNKIMTNEADEDIFYYLEVPCKNSNYTIIIFELEYINSSNAYTELCNIVENIEKLCDCIIASGANSNDIDALEIVAAKLAKKLNDIDLSHIPNNKEHDEMIEELIDNASEEFMIINIEDNKEHAVFFYRLLMDNLLYEIVKNLHAQNISMALDLYIYEKVRKYLHENQS